MDQLIPPKLFEILTNLGIGGFMLWWFMARCEKRMVNMEAAMDRMTRAVLAVSMSSTNNDSGKAVIASMVKEVEEAIKLREGKAG